MENEFEDLVNLLAGCRKQDRKCQKLLYKSFYGFAMAICLRYARNRAEASEIMNNGFFKVFSDIKEYNSKKSFNAWLGRIMTHISIDYYRDNLNELITDDIENSHVAYTEPSEDTYREQRKLLAMIQQLPDRLRLAFNLYAIDGYTHKEIGEILGNSEGASRVLLFRAREILKKMIEATGWNQLYPNDFKTKAFV